MHADLLESILWEAIAMFLVVGSVLGILVGLSLILRPHLMLAVNSAASRWISTRRLNLMLDRSISIEHWFFRHHREVGVLAVLGAAYLLIYFGLLFDKAAAIQHLGAHIHPKLLGGLLDALVLGSLIGGAGALMTGLFLWWRPSLLRGIEAGANQWISTRLVARALDRPRGQLDRLVARHAPRVGWLLLLGSLYLLFALIGYLL